jgi:2-oxoglutarate dehydrogenase E2 component (dihydrolipoamide succinyltransferase)
MATIDVIMPQMGESIAEGTLSRWIKKVGEPVKRDEPIFEISTDKVDAEIPAPAAGVLSEILVQEGQTVAVQTVVARIDTEAAAGASAPAPAAPASAPATPTPASTPQPAAAAAPAPPTPPKVPAPAPAPPAPAARPAAEKSRAGHVAEGNGEMETAEERLRRRSTPLVRKMAAEHGLDLSAIPGTGLAGRVTKNDVLGYIDSGAAARRGPAPAHHPAPAPVAAPAGEPAAAAAASQPRAPAAPGVEPWEGDRVEPWSRIRKLTAEHMVMSRRVSPHVNTIFEIDYSRVAQLRAKKKHEYAERGVNLTFLAFIAKAAADALRRHPTLNAAVSGESTILRRDINLGIAVALEWGLIVPVIRHADELSLLGLARAINDVGERARGKKLSPDEVQKGTFTITNPGVFGALFGTPIINQPQVAILGVGAIEKRPVVVDDAIGIRPMAYLTLGYDHRLIDGAVADQFMSMVKHRLENWDPAQP